WVRITLSNRLSTTAYDAVAAFDPVHTRTIVLNRLDNVIRTHTLSEEGWAVLPGEETLPEAATHGLAFDPVHQRMVLSLVRDNVYEVWTMSMLEESGWEQAGVLEFTPSTRPLVWDERSCGFLMASQGEDCQVELWLMRLSENNGAFELDVTQRTRFGLAEPSYAQGAMYLDTERDRLVMAGGIECGGQDWYLDVLDVVPLVR
ncbi:MAG: hypothetical protein AAFX99_29370, partial [Myxococcota bacterium]